MISFKCEGIQYVYTMNNVLKKYMGVEVNQNV
jgi:hypothetical protein